MYLFKKLSLFIDDRYFSQFIDDRCNGIDTTQKEFEILSNNRSVLKSLLSELDENLSFNRSSIKSVADFGYLITSSNLEVQNKFVELFADIGVMSEIYSEINLGPGSDGERSLLSISEITIENITEFRALILANLYNSEGIRNQEVIDLLTTIKLPDPNLTMSKIFKSFDSFEFVEFDSFYNNLADLIDDYIFEFDYYDATEEQFNRVYEFYDMQSKLLFFSYQNIKYQQYPRLRQIKILSSQNI